MQNTLRQIIDLQVQAERIIQHSNDLDEIEQFACYNTEMKTFLLNNTSEKFILDHINAIPEINLHVLETPGIEMASATLVGSILGILGYWNKERKKIEAAKEIIRDVKGKYASLEFMLRNSY